VNDDQILLLLDGLDEISPGYRSECVKAINTYRREHGLTPIVVCSRIDDYLHQKTRLKLQGAVTIQPLTMQQIDAYISSAERELAPLRVALRTDPLLQELVITPLMLSILAVTFQGKSIEGLQAHGLRNEVPSTDFIPLSRISLLKKVEMVYSKAGDIVAIKQGESYDASFLQ